MKVKDLCGGPGLFLVEVDVLSPIEKLVHPLQLLPCLISPLLQPLRRLTLSSPAPPVDRKAGVLPPRQLDHRPPGPLRPPVHLPLLPLEAQPVIPHEGVNLVLDLCLKHEPPVKRRREGGGGRGGGQDRGKPVPDI